jgi:hypothetical protein
VAFSGILTALADLMNYHFGGAEVQKAAQGRHAATTKGHGCPKDNHHLF